MLDQEDKSSKETENKMLEDKRNMEVKGGETQRREWSTGSDITEQSCKTDIGEDVHYFAIGKLTMTLLRTVSVE